MKVYASRLLPTTQELVEILNQEFSGRYTSKLFGLGKDKTIMVRESPFAGAQISIRENEITVQGTPSPVMAVFGVTEIVVISAFFIFLSRLLAGSSWKGLEKEVAVFLHQKYAAV